MITLHGFGRVNPLVIGLTRDLRVQWALEELGLPYRVHGLDHTGGELDGDAHHRISYFHQLPILDDDGFVVAESGAILLYLAEKAGKLPTDIQRRTAITQWCFAALTTVEPPLVQILTIDLMRKAGEEARRAELVKWAGRPLSGLERRLDGRPWIADDDFTVADILLTTVLREIRETDLLDPYPRLKDYYARASARPAWQRTLALYAQRLGVTADDIR